MRWPTERSEGNVVEFRWPDLTPFSGGATVRSGRPERGAQDPPIRWPDKKRGPLEITVYWADVDGRWEPVGTQILALDHAPITATSLRRLPWGRITDEARPGPTEFGFKSSDMDGSPLEWSHRVGFEKTRRGRPPKYGPEHFAEVARVYREAFGEKRLTPTRAVAKRFKATESQAAKWVARCRELGLLPKTTRGKARFVPQRKGRR